MPTSLINTFENRQRVCLVKGNLIETQDKGLAPKLSQITITSLPKIEFGTNRSKVTDAIILKACLHDSQSEISTFCRKW